MGRWHRNSDKWDYELQRNIEQHRNEIEYNERFADMDPINSSIEYADPLDGVLEGLGWIVNIIFAARLVNKFAIKKDFTVNKEEGMFVLLIILRVLIPEINLILLVWSFFKLKKKLKESSEK